MTEHAATGPTPGRPRRWPLILAFLTPALLLYVVFVVYPILQGARYSLYDWNGLEPLDRLRRPRQLHGCVRRRTVSRRARAQRDHPRAVAAAAAPLRARPGRAARPEPPRPGVPAHALLRALTSLSEVVTGVVWRQILRPDGLLDGAVIAVGAGEPHPGPGSRTRTSSCTALFFVISWKYFGFHMILMLAGLQQIPTRAHGGGGRSTARSPWQTFRHVTLPLLGPTLRVSVFLSIIGALQLFDLVWVTTKGGPIGCLVDDGHVPVRPVPQAACSATPARSRSSSSALSLVVALAYQRWSRFAATSKGPVSLAELESTSRLQRAVTRAAWVDPRRPLPRRVHRARR